MAGKPRRTLFSVKVEYQAQQRLELVHGDLCGPISSMTPQGNRYFLLLVDDLNHFMWVAAIPSKDCAVAAIREIQARPEAESGVKLRVHYPGVRRALGGHRCESPAHGSIHPVVEWHRRAAERHGGGDGQKHAQGQGPARMVLGQRQCSPPCTSSTGA